MVMQAANGKEASNILKSNPVSWFALITDFNMPEMNGGELISFVIESKIALKKIIVVSA